LVRAWGSLRGTGYQEGGLDGAQDQIHVALVGGGQRAEQGDGWVGGDGDRSEVGGSDQAHLVGLELFPDLRGYLLRRGLEVEALGTEGLNTSLLERAKLTLVAATIPRKLKSRDRGKSPETYLSRE
jgi:hypothetical protein